MTSNLTTARARFGIAFSLLARRWRRSLEARLADAGLTATTWLPLIHVQETGGGLTQKELALLVGVDSSSLVRVLDIHVRDGLIERRRDETDGRARLIHLTLKGEKRVAEIRNEILKQEELMLADVSDDAISLMIDQFALIDQKMTVLENSSDADRA